MEFFILKKSIFFSVISKIFDFINKFMAIENKYLNNKRIFYNEMVMIINFKKNKNKTIKYVDRIKKINYHPPDT